MVAIFLVVAGVAVVGVSSQTDSGGDEDTTTTGIILILVAQIFTGI